VTARAIDTAALLVIEPSTYTPSVPSIIGRTTGSKTTGIAAEAKSARWRMSSPATRTTVVAPSDTSSACVIPLGIRPLIFGGRR
jgi:hypothetical protein